MNFITACVEGAKFVGRNWKTVAILFGLGGTVTVLGVIPGTEPVRDIAQQQIEVVKTHLVVSATAPEILE